MHCRPCVSIIVPAHNSEAFVGRTLASIRAQSFQDWECVVVDDGSVDQTSAVVEAVSDVDKRVRLVRQRCGGSSLARNRGYLESCPSSEYVSFMDADDIWEPGALDVLLGRLRECPDAVGAHALAEFIDASGSPLEPGRFSAFGRRRLGYRDGAIQEWSLDDPTIFDTLVWTGPMYPPGLLLARRTVYEKVGLFDLGLLHCEDWDMCLRLSRQGRIEFVNEVLLSYRRHHRNQSNDQRGSGVMVRKLHWKTFFSPENTAAQRVMLRAGWKAWQMYKAKEKWRLARSAPIKERPAAMLSAMASLPVYAMRYLRGYPTRAGI
jgi:glycosyltransferase involved in cell wall biosynthesis